MDAERGQFALRERHRAPDGRRHGDVQRHRAARMRRLHEKRPTARHTVVFRFRLAVVRIRQKLVRHIAHRNDRGARASGDIRQRIGQEIVWCPRRFPFAWVPRTIIGDHECATRQRVLRNVKRDFVYPRVRAHELIGRPRLRNKPVRSLFDPGQLHDACHRVVQRLVFHRLPVAGERIGQIAARVDWARKSDRRGFGARVGERQHRQGNGTCNLVPHVWLLRVETMCFLWRLSASRRKNSSTACCGRAGRSRRFCRLRRCRRRSGETNGVFSKARRGAKCIVHLFRSIDERFKKKSRQPDRGHSSTGISRAVATLECFVAPSRFEVDRLVCPANARRGLRVCTERCVENRARRVERACDER
ncbi:Uncharacterised protein [Burkholderia pseudomallei]|nr:Uncharacterised protein [Burkholderia pseudomallei]